MAAFAMEETDPEGGVGLRMRVHTRTLLLSHRVFRPPEIRKSNTGAVRLRHWSGGAAPQRLWQLERGLAKLKRRLGSRPSRRCGTEGSFHFRGDLHSVSGREQSRSENDMHRLPVVL